MKNKLKFLWWVLGILAVVGAYAVFAGSLRSQMEETLTAACKRTVTIRSAQFTLPPAIRLIGLEVARAHGEARAPLKVDMIQASLAASSWMQGQPGGELEVFHPQFYMEWTLEARAVTAMGGAPVIQSAGVPITRVQVHNGDLTFVDRTTVPNVFWNFQETDFTAQPGTRPAEQAFTLSSRLKDEQGRELGTVRARGTWLSGGPVDAQVELSDRDISKLSGYLRKVLGTAPSRGAMQMDVRLTVHQGVLMAHSDVTATGVVFSDSQPTTLGLDGNRLVELLKDRDGKIHLSFIVAGKLGEKLDWSDLAAGAMREAMRQAMSRSIQKVLSDTEQDKPVGELLQKKMDSLGR